MLQTILSRRSLEPPALIFAPLAWLKLQFLCHVGETEVGGFGVAAEKNPLYVTDFVTVRQRVSFASVRFDDDSVADYFDRCVDAGLSVQRFSRVWLHTHPGDSPAPSGTDEETFARVFGACDWSLMFIIAKSGASYARLNFSAGPGGEMLLPVEVDWSAWPDMLASAPGELEAHFEEWRKEYLANIEAVFEMPVARLQSPVQGSSLDHNWWETEPWHPDLDDLYYYLTEQEREHEFF